MADSQQFWMKTHSVPPDAPTTKTPWRETGRSFCGRIVDLDRECPKHGTLPTCPICRERLLARERMEA